jgi:hypothetical protein
VSNGPTENLNLKIKNTKRVARGYRNFAYYRLRLLLNRGRIQEDHSPTRIRPAVPGSLGRARLPPAVGAAARAPLPCGLARRLGLVGRRFASDWTQVISQRMPISSQKTLSNHKFRIADALAGAGGV